MRTNKTETITQLKTKLTIMFYLAIHSKQYITSCRFRKLLLLCWELRLILWARMGIMAVQNVS